MAQLSPADLKPHLSIPVDYVGDDALITDYIASAEAMIARHVRRDLDTEFPGGWPGDALQALRVQVAHLWMHRGDDATDTGIANAAARILQPLRNLAG